MLPSADLRELLPADHARFRFEVLPRSKYGATVRVYLRSGTFADGGATRHVFVPYRRVYDRPEAIVRMVVEGSEHALSY